MTGMGSRFRSLGFCKGLRFRSYKGGFRGLIRRLRV